MLSTVSWQDFLLTIGMLLVLYYSAVLLALYRPAIIKLLREGIPVKGARLFNTGTSATEVAPGASTIMAALNQVFAQAVDKKYHREELLQALRSCLHPYAHLKATPFEAAITYHITQSAVTSCSIYLTDNDLQQLW